MIPLSSRKPLLQGIVLLWSWSFAVPPIAVAYNNRSSFTSETRRRRKTPITTQTGFAPLSHQPWLRWPGRNHNNIRRHTQQHRQGNHPSSSLSLIPRLATGESKGRGNLGLGVSIPAVSGGAQPASARRSLIRNVLLVSAAFLVVLLGARSHSWAATATGAAATSRGSLPAIIGPVNVGLAATLLSCVGVASLALQNFGDIARSLAVAATRCALQLCFAGGFLLTYFLGTQQPAIVGVWLAFTVWYAAREARARVTYTYPLLSRHLVVAIGTAAATVVGFTGALRVLGPLTPWFAPRTWIPVTGMLLGNGVTATALAAAALTRELATKRDQVELWLARGATGAEATASVLRAAYLAGLTPTINALTVTGVVHIPGTMTGQLLAGQEPFQAAAYQILIFMLIASTSCTSVQMFANLALGTMMDRTDDRLRTDQLRPRGGEGDDPNDPNSATKKGNDSKAPVLTSLWQRLRGTTSTRTGDNWDNMPINGASLKGAPTDVRYVDLRSPAKTEDQQSAPSTTGADNTDNPPVLSLSDMCVDRTCVKITLDVKSGDRIGIQGPSGIGKSQILRTLAGLEPLDRASVSLRGTSATEIDMPTWRQRVALVPQERPTLEGTPREFFNKVLAFDSQTEATVDKATAFQDLAQLASRWGLPVAVFDQPWSSLSGGESQRASLIIAIALKPQVLLLDESTSALDESTALVVENTLKSLHIPILMVSHSNAQVDRFCNKLVDLAPAGPLSWSRFG